MPRRRCRSVQSKLGGGAGEAVKDARGKAKYEVKVKRADDCAVVDLIPEITSPTARDVALTGKSFS